MIGIRDRVNQDGITAEARATDSRPPWDDRHWQGHAYDVTLTYDGRTLVVPFYMGEALTEEPDAATVLDALASDSAGYDNARDFEDWAGEYGYDTDSRKAERTYRLIGKQREQLATFLGDAYDAYLWDTDRL